MSSNETFNAECLSCVGKGQYWTSTSHFADLLSGCAQPNDNGRCFGQRRDIKCARVQNEDERDCNEICSKFAGSVDECSTSRCRLDTQFHCYDDPVSLEVWVPIVCGVVWLANMIFVLNFVQRKGQKPFPKYVLLCLFLGPFVWPWVLYSTRHMSTVADSTDDGGSAEATMATIEQLAYGRMGRTTAHGQPPDHYGRSLHIGQPPSFSGHALPLGNLPPYSQGMQPALYGPHLHYTGAGAGQSQHQIPSGVHGHILQAPNYHSHPSPNPVGGIGQPAKLPQAFVQPASDGLSPESQSQTHSMSPGPPNPYLQAP
jgi:hypothetical protein